MAEIASEEHKAGASPMARLASTAFILILIPDLGLLLWGAMAALLPEHLVGPNAAPILAAGYESFTHRPWAELARSSPESAEFMTVLFRVYGAFNVAFAVLAICIALTAFRRHERWAWWSLLIGNTIAFVAAMTYDRTVGAIGPFEMLEYVGLAGIYGALAVTARKPRTR